MARRFGKTPKEKAFKPMYHPERLDQPQKVKKPSVIFVCSAADLFGEWISDYWITRVMLACRKAPQHLYLFLTKNPNRYRKFSKPWPEHYMIGITSQGQLVPTTGRSRGRNFISFEPLLQEPPPPLYYDRLLPYFGWVIIGAQTGPGAVKPKRSWVELILYQSMKHKVPVFMKDNLKDVWKRKLIQEYPKAVEEIREGESDG